MAWVIIEPMKTVGIGVGGRFHSDFMYQALTDLGYSPQILTSLPKNRFLISDKGITNFIWPELVFRAARNIGFESSGDALKMKCFGRFLSDYLLKNRPDSFYWMVLIFFGNLEESSLEVSCFDERFISHQVPVSASSERV